MYQTLPMPLAGAPLPLFRRTCLLALLLPSLALWADEDKEASYNPSSVRFADPSKPGRLSIYISQGDVHVSPCKNPGEIRVRSSAEPEKSETRSDGLRILGSAEGNFQLSVEGNDAQLNYGKGGLPHGGSADFYVEVPENTHLDIQNGWGGDVKIDGISGDIAVRGLNGDIEAKGLAGAFNVETVNGEVKAYFNQITADKTVSISSMNGEVKLKIPGDSKAQVRFRTLHGTILTDFPESALKASTKDLGGSGWTEVAGHHIAVATQVASEVGRELAANAKEIAAEVKEAMREARRAKKEAEEAKKLAEQEAQRDREVAQIEAEAAEALKAPEAPKAPFAPRAPRPPKIPAISGGRVVTGSLNGGGTEILVTTLHGDITLRHNP